MQRILRSLSFISQRYQVGPQGEGSPLTPAFPQPPLPLPLSGESCTSKCRFFHNLCCSVGRKAVTQIESQVFGKYRTQIKQGFFIYLFLVGFEI